MDNPDAQATIDGYFMHSADEQIKAWLASKEGCEDAMIQGVVNALAMKDNVKKVMVIWYVTQQDKAGDIAAIEIFNRLNKGKIGLTAAELIKALFILSCKRSDGDTDGEQQKFAMLWDMMEQRFQDESFWAFISSSDEPQTRIDVLFDFVSNKGKNADADHAYRWFQKIYDEDPRSFVNQWKFVRTVFDEMNFWYEDVTLHNLIGYLIYFGKTPLEIHNCLDAAKKKDQDWTLEKTYAAVRKMVSSGLKNVNLEMVDYKENPSDIRKLLMLFNVVLYCTSRLRFPFDRIKTEKWDIEHVDSQTTNNLQELRDKLRWIEYVCDVLRTDPSEAAIVLLQRGEQLRAILEAEQHETNNNFSNYYQDVVSYYTAEADGDAAPQANGSIGNLVLLDSSTNRSYQNAPFPYKRYRILDRDKKGLFVPLGTKNVFLKYYSNAAANGASLDAIRWSASDQNRYMQTLNETLRPYLEGAN